MRFLRVFHSLSGISAIQVDHRGYAAREPAIKVGGHRDSRRGGLDSDAETPNVAGDRADSRGDGSDSVGGTRDSRGESNDVA